MCIRDRETTEHTQCRQQPNTPNTPRCWVCLVVVDIEYARSSPEAAEEELDKVKDLFQELSDLIGDDDTQFTPDGDIHGGEDDPRPVAGSPP